VPPQFAKSSSLILPRIPLPTFSDKFSEWQTFRHTFQSLVHSNKAMTTIAKFHYLKSSVIGDAALILDRFEISPDSYNDAWEMLLKEYDNKRALIRTHLQSFVCLPKGKFETAAELKKLRDTVSVAFAMLSKLGCQVSSWDPLLVFIVTEKLGSKTRAKWNDKLGDAREYLSYKELDAFLNGRIHSLSDFAGVATILLLYNSIIREIKDVPC